MSSALVPPVALFATLTIFWAVAFAAPERQAFVPDEQPNSNVRGGVLQEIVNEVGRARRTADTVAGRPSNAAAKASGSGATDFGVAVGQSVSAVGTALGGSARVNVTAIGSGANAGGVAIGGDAHAIGNAVGGSAQIILDGVNGGKASGQVYGGNAKATGDAVGGDAVIGDSANAFNSFGDDFWASVGKPLNNGGAAAASSNNGGAAAASSNNAAVGGNSAAGGSAGVHSADPSAGNQRDSDALRAGLTSAATRWARTSTFELAMVLSAWQFINSVLLSRA